MSMLPSLRCRDDAFHDLDDQTSWGERQTECSHRHICLEGYELRLRKRQKVPSIGGADHMVDSFRSQILKDHIAISVLIKEHIDQSRLRTVSRERITPKGQFKSVGETVSICVGNQRICSGIADANEDSGVGFNDIEKSIVIRIRIVWVST